MIVSTNENTLGPLCKRYKIFVTSDKGCYIYHHISTNILKIFKFNKMVTYTLLTHNVKARDPVGSKNLTVTGNIKALN